MMRRNLRLVSVSQDLTFLPNDYLLIERMLYCLCVSQEDFELYLKIKTLFLWSNGLD